MARVQWSPNKYLDGSPRVVLVKIARSFSKAQCAAGLKYSQEGRQPACFMTQKKVWCWTFKLNVRWTSYHRYFVTSNFEARKVLQILIPRKMFLLVVGTKLLDGVKTEGVKKFDCLKLATSRDLRVLIWVLLFPTRTQYTWHLFL